MLKIHVPMTLNIWYMYTFLCTGLLHWWTTLIGHSLPSAVCSSSGQVTKSVWLEVYHEWNSQCPYCTTHVNHLSPSSSFFLLLLLLLLLLLFLLFLLFLFRCSSVLCWRVSIVLLLTSILLWIVATLMNMREVTLRSVWVPAWYTCIHVQDLICIICAYTRLHTQSAINIWDKDSLLQHFFTSPSYPGNDKREIVIFHCEFSSKRGPEMYAHIGVCSYSLYSIHVHVHVYIHVHCILFTLFVSQTPGIINY